MTRIGMRNGIEVELQVLAAENDGGLTPERVVERARDPNSPLHQAFEWDDTEASRKYRLEQARGLIRSVKIVVTTETMRIKTHGFVRDPGKEAGEQGYLTVPRVRTEEEMTSAVMAQELDRLEALMKRVFDLATALGREDEVAEFMTAKMNEARRNAA